MLPKDPTSYLRRIAFEAVGVQLVQGRKSFYARWNSIPAPAFLGLTLLAGLEVYFKKVGAAMHTALRPLCFDKLPSLDDDRSCASNQARFDHGARLIPSSVVLRNQPISAYSWSSTVVEYVSAPRFGAWHTTP